MGALRKMEIIQAFAGFFGTGNDVSPEEEDIIKKFGELGDKVCANVTLVEFDFKSNNKGKDNKAKVKDNNENSEKSKSETPQTKGKEDKGKEGRGGRE